jgi:hypothetical protein
MTGIKMLITLAKMIVIMVAAIVIDMRFLELIPII